MIVDSIRSSIAKWLYQCLHGEVANICRELEVTDFLTKEQIEQYQFRKLKRLLYYSNYVPYYRELYNAYGIQTDDIKDFSDYKKIPILTKSAIRLNQDKLISVLKMKSKAVRTSGSTGEPITILKDINSRNIELALVRRFEKLMGIELGDKTLSIWGGLEMSTRGKIVKKIKNYLYNRDLFNNYDINTNNIDRLIVNHGVNKYKYIRGYATSLALIAQALRRKDRKFCPYSNLKAISASVEKLLSTDRQIIEDVFGKILYDQYGCGEVNSIAFECPHHNGLHHSFEHSYIEVLDLKGRESDSGRLIITNLDNLVFPLIRYENGDLINLSSQECSCGRKSMLISSIKGRTFDYIEGINGSVVHGGFFDDLLLESNANVEQIQFVQDTARSICVRYVGGTDMSVDAMAFIESKIKGQLGSEMQIHFRKVEFINVEDNGKRKLVKKTL